LRAGEDHHAAEESRAQLNRIQQRAVEFRITVTGGFGVMRYWRHVIRLQKPTCTLRQSELLKP
jgi:hypothetical protein